MGMESSEAEPKEAEPVGQGQWMEPCVGRALGKWWGEVCGRGLVWAGPRVGRAAGGAAT